MCRETLSELTGSAYRLQLSTSKLFCEYGTVNYRRPAGYKPRVIANYSNVCRAETELET